MEPAAITTNQSGRKRLCFWLTDNVGPLHRDFALELGLKNFDIQFFGTLDLLVAETRLRRPAVIIIGDEGHDQLVEKAILTLTSMPDISGSRLVMTLSKHHENLKRYAACSAFRDLIPMNLEKNQWLQRFTFATSSNDSAIPKPAMQLTLNSIAAINAPARIVALSKDKIWIECRLRPHRGANLQIIGPMADALGVNSLTAVISETRSSKLNYRFSDALVAEWKSDDLGPDGVKRILEELQQIDAGPRCRVFAAIQDGQVRSSLLRQLDVLQFEVTTALHKMSIVQEPKFFSPNIVFVEDQLCMGEHQLRFLKMLANLADDVPVVIVGNKVRSDEAQAFAPNRRVFVLPRITQNFLTLLWKRFLPKESRTFRHRIAEGAIYIASDHLYSIAQVAFPARITRLHPNSLQLALPFPMSQYGVMQLQSPLLKKIWGRDPYAKAVQIYESRDPGALGFPFRASCVFCDADTQDQKLLGQALVRSLTDQFHAAPNTSIRSVGATPSVSYAEDSTLLNKKDITTAGEKILTSTVDPMVRPTGVSPVSTIHTKNYMSGPSPAGTRVESVLLRQAPAVFGEDSRTEKVGPSPSRQKPSKKTNKDLKYAGVFVLFTAGALALVWLVSIVASSHWQRSGGQYTDALMKMYPNRTETEAPKNEMQDESTSH